MKLSKSITPTPAQARSYRLKLERRASDEFEALYRRDMRKLRRAHTKRVQELKREYTRRQESWVARTCQKLRTALWSLRQLSDLLEVPVTTLFRWQQRHLAPESTAGRWPQSHEPSRIGRRTTADRSADADPIAPRADVGEDHTALAASISGRGPVPVSEPSRVSKASLRGTARNGRGVCAER